MKFNYKLRRLCGAYYGHPVSTTGTHSTETQWGGSNLVFVPHQQHQGTDSHHPQHHDVLLSAVSNRLQVLDLRSLTVRTLPIEARSNIRCIAVSPDGLWIVTADIQQYIQLIHFHRAIVLHRWRVKHVVRVMQFDPSGQYLAVSCGKQVQVWCTPTLQHQERTFSPMTLHRTYTGPTDHITCLAWSHDGSVLAAGSRDGTIHLWTLQTVRNFCVVRLTGHNDSVVGVYLVEDSNNNSKNNTKFGSLQQQPQQVMGCYSIAHNGAVFQWSCVPVADIQREDIQGPPNDDDEDDEDSLDEERPAFDDDALPFFAERQRGSVNDEKLLSTSGARTNQAHLLVGAKWSLTAKHYLGQDFHAKVTSTTYSARNALLVVGFSSGLFTLYEMPSMAQIHSLSVGHGQRIQACILNEPSGDWLALGCPASQQLLVWEWRSETYVLKQRGHAYGMRCMAYSPDGIVLCTGGEDGLLKLWNAMSGFCYVTLAERTHTAAVTAVVFANASVVLSASLDGTVKAHDLHRYRTFRTMTPPKPVQFLSLAVDASGEIVTAGCMDPFHIYVWNLQTGRLLDVLTGHTGPVSSLVFSANTLVSSSWDGTVQTWDLFSKGSTVSTESLQHSTDVVCVSVRPDGHEICAATVNGMLSFWHVATAKLQSEIDGRKDIVGGRKLNDRVAANNNAAGRYFTSICYSADGTCLLAGGNSKYVCIYHIDSKMLLKKFQVTFNRSFDGVLDELNSKNLGLGGPIDENADSGDEDGHRALALPGARRGDDGSRTSMVEVLTRQVAFSSTGREWAAVSGEGLHVYSLDEDMIFDPIALTEAMTPAAVKSKLSSGDYGLALRMALHLNEYGLVKQVLEETPFASIAHVVRMVGPEPLQRLLQLLAKIAVDSPHIEFYVQWCLELLQTHGMYMDQHRGTYMRAFRALHRVLQSRYNELQALCDENKYMLDFLQDQGAMLLRQQQEARSTSS